MKRPSFLLHDRTTIAVAIAALAALLIVGCATVPTEIAEDLSQAELIQLAQESADQENWEAAQAYYQAVLDRYSKDRAATATAIYEIAFIDYKRGDLAAAQSGFERLLGMYDFEGDVLPAWPRVIAERLMAEISATAEE